jgi:hypothetical protein
MLMLQPEVVLAAVQRSERLGQLNRHLCRPLDRPMLSGQLQAEDAPDLASDDEIDTSH